MSSSSSSKAPENPPAQEQSEEEFLKYFDGVPGCTCPPVDIYVRSQYGFRERCETCVKLGCPYTETDENFGIWLSLGDLKDLPDYDYKKAGIVANRKKALEKCWGIEFLGIEKVKPEKMAKEMAEYRKKLAERKAKKAAAQVNRS